MLVRCTRRVLVIKNLNRFLIFKVSALSKKWWLEKGIVVVFLATEKM